MLIIKYLIIIEVILIALISWKKNPDPFSPVKIYLVFSIFFYLAVFFQEVRWETLLCYVALIQLVALSFFFEKKRSNVTTLIANISSTKLRAIIWILSVPGIATMIYFVWEAGGILQYFGVIAVRVAAWKGKGYFVVLLNTLPTLNLLYFASIVANKTKTLLGQIYYSLHFVIFVIIGLLTGSRSYIGVSLLGMYMIWCYVIGRPKIRYAVMLTCILVFFVSIMGTVRNNYGGEIGAGFWSNVLKPKNIETAQMGYGSNPLEIVFSSPEKIFLGGLTYLSLITNSIPRVLYPDKPDTGGITFTKIYTDDQWGGFSYLATGAVTEGILNFGIPMGVIFGILLNGVILLGGCAFYNNAISVPSQRGEPLDLFRIIAFFYIILACARFSYGEFTDIFQSLIFFNLLPLFLIKIGLRLKFG